MPNYSDTIVFHRFLMSYVKLKIMRDAQQSSRYRLKLILRAIGDCCFASDRKHAHLEVL